MVNYSPDRGDIIWLEFEPQAGKEIQNTRPALVISPLAYNKKAGLAICMPITSKIKNYPFEVKLSNKKIEGAVLSDQIRSLDWQARNAKFICKCDKNSFTQVIKKFSLLIN